MILNITVPKNRIKIANECVKDMLSFLKDVKITSQENSFFIEGENVINVYKAYNILLAIGRGFGKDDSMLLLNDEYRIEIVPIEAFAKTRNRQIVLKGRVIGKEGKTKKLIEKYTKTKIVVFGKTIGIIGKWDCVKVAREAIEMFLRGSKHSSVYKNLEGKVKSLSL